MAELKPEILIWARETAGLDLAAAAKKVGLNPAKGISGADRLALMESGLEPVSSSLLVRMSEQYHRPLLTFYLRSVPMADELGQDFRTLPDRGDPSNLLLVRLLRDVKARQSLAREALEEDDDAVEVALVGSRRGEKSPQALADAIVEALDFDRAKFRAQSTVDDAFTYLRTLIEAKGVFVLLAGDCGSWQTAIDVQTFRGFALSDSVAPFIVINDQDARSAWSFTALHELAHLLIGAAGVSGGTPRGDIEQLCNDAAAATLISRDEIVTLTGRDNVEFEIDMLAARARVSRAMIAYQFFRVGLIDRDRWDGLREHYRSEWLTQRDADRKRNKGKEGGPNYYVVRRHRLGSALIGLARQGMAEGSLTPTRAARLLGVKPMAVYPLLADPQRARAS